MIFEAKCYAEFANIAYLRHPKQHEEPLKFVYRMKQEPSPLQGAPATQLPTDEALRQAASEGMDAFVNLFTDTYLQQMGGSLTAESMPLLTADQHTLLAYRILRDELMEGGFCQLIQNGYGGYIFHNPVAKALRQWGLNELGKLLYAAREIYEAHCKDLERERSDEEFMAMYEQYEVFDELEEQFLDKEEYFTATVAQYVDDHIEKFILGIRENLIPNPSSL